MKSHSSVTAYGTNTIISTTQLGPLTSPALKIPQLLYPSEHDYLKHVILWMRMVSYDDVNVEIINQKHGGAFWGDGGFFLSLSCGFWAAARSTRIREQWLTALENWCIQMVRLRWDKPEIGNGVNVYSLVLGYFIFKSRAVSRILETNKKRKPNQGMGPFLLCNPIAKLEF